VAPMPPPPTPTEAPELYVVSGSNRVRGFAFGDGEHVITLLRAVRHRGSITVVLPTGERVDAGVVATDGQLALLRTSAPIGAPLPVRLELRPGDVLGRSAPRNALSGMVLARRGNRLQVSAVCERGALLYDGEGRIAAFCTGGDRATAAEAFRELFESADGDSRSPWRGRLTFDFRYRIQKGFDSVFGGELGIGAVGWDRLGFMLRVGVASDAQQDENGPLRRELPIEFTGEVQFHHAFRLANVPLRIVVGAGALFRIERISTTTTFASFAPGCDPASERCSVTFDDERSEDTDYRVLPNLRLELNVGGLALSYSATLEVEREIEDTTHSLGLGFAF
ncbi:MAG: hypothetical protein AAF645_20785, partial [Myxococcota bacterium]